MTIEPLIELNHRPYPWQEGMTISSLMAENGFSFSHIIATINGIVIEDEAWDKAPVAAGDKVAIIHIFHGG